MPYIREFLDYKLTAMAMQQILAASKSEHQWVNGAKDTLSLLVSSSTKNDTSHSAPLI